MTTEYLIHCKMCGEELSPTREWRHSDIPAMNKLIRAGPLLAELGRYAESTDFTLMAGTDGFWLTIFEFFRVHSTHEVVVVNEYGEQIAR